MAIIGAINNLLLDQEEKRERFRELVMTPNLVLSYALLLYVRSGYVVSFGFDEDSLERFFLERRDVFEQEWNLDNSFSYRLRIERFLSSEELNEARSSHLQHPSIVSVVSQLLKVLNANVHCYPSGFLDSMKLHEAQCLQA